MGVLDARCLYSTVRNTSGLKLHFSFLPPHGVELLANEEFTVLGHIVEAVAGRADRAEARKYLTAFERAIETGDMEIVHTPAPILQDQTTGVSKMLRLHNGVLGVADPCWESASISANPTPF